MTIHSGFFDSVNHDRKYSVSDFGNLFSGLITDGVYSGVGQKFSVSVGSAGKVNVGTGRAWFKGIWVYNDATVSVNLSDANAQFPRWDTVVIEVNRTDSVRACAIKMVEGTASANPTKNTGSHSSTVDQYPLAYIYRAAGSAKVISSSNITIAVGSSTTPFVTGILQNLSIQDLLDIYKNDIDTLITRLNAAISQAGQAQLIDKAVTPQKLSKPYFAAEEPMVMKSGIHYGSSFPTNPVEGQLFFKVVN